jgi:hypothetical protein
MEAKTAEPSVTANASSSHPQTADFGVRIGASVSASLVKVWIAGPVVFLSHISNCLFR